MDVPTHGVWNITKKMLAGPQLRGHSFTRLLHATLGQTEGKIGLSHAGENWDPLTGPLPRVLRPQVSAPLPLLPLRQPASAPPLGVRFPRGLAVRRCGAGLATAVATSTSGASICFHLLSSSLSCGLFCRCRCCCCCYFCLGGGGGLVRLALLLFWVPARLLHHVCRTHRFKGPETMPDHCACSWGIDSESLSMATVSISCHIRREEQESSCQTTVHLLQYTEREKVDVVPYNHTRYLRSIPPSPASFFP